MFLLQDQKFERFITYFMLLSCNEPLTTCHKPLGLQGPNIRLFCVHRCVCLCVYVYSKHATTWHKWYKPLLVVQSQTANSSTCVTLY